MTVRVAIIGYGKIAHDQHVPAIVGNPAFTEVARVMRHPTGDEGVPTFPSLVALLADMPGEVDAVAICTPPGVRHAIARDALRAGLHVLVEKPPAATFGEAVDLKAIADAAQRTIYAAWHSQHNAAVSKARQLLQGAGIAHLDIEWREDVRKWHPGQEWIWAAGGFGVFDPGINALSIATAILPMPLLVTAAELVFPANRQAPIAASLRFAGGDFAAKMDWRHTPDECWTIRMTTEDGRQIDLLEGGGVLVVDGIRQPTSASDEYPSIYARFAELIASGASELDTEPLRIVADAFLIGERTIAEPFV